MQQPILTVDINPHSVTIAFFTQTESPLPIHLQAFDRIPAYEIALNRAVPYNSSALVLYIESFIKKHRIPTKYLALSISGDPLKETLISCSQEEIVHHYSSENHYQTHYIQLNNRSHNIATWYIAGLPNPLILQYQLIAFRSNLMINRITSTKYALITLYKYIHASTYRDEKLINDLYLHQSNVSLICPDLLHRIIKTSALESNLTYDDAPSIFAVGGLALLERNS